MTTSFDAAPTVRTTGTFGDGAGPIASSTPLTSGIGREAEQIVEAVCEGGPRTLPAELRSHRVPLRERKIKVRHYGGYEHFEREGDAVADGTPVVFRWSGRTRIAE